MRSFRTVHSLRQKQRVSNAIHSLNSFRRHSSTQPTAPENLTERRPNRICDHLAPLPSHLLNQTLADFLPPSCHPSKSEADKRGFPQFLAPGHHLVYFPPQLPSSKLLPDGTDSLHSPGGPWVRRMWAGGSLAFPREGGQIFLGRGRAEIKETITSTSMKGTGDNEKYFVTIERECIVFKEKAPKGLREGRHLVFMKEKSPEAAKEDAAKPAKFLKPAHEPDFSVKMTPTQALLFRFSALTFNAHAIHLDRQYAREVEGHRNLLVHGPLTVILMLSVLRSQLKEPEYVLTFDYRNLAPLYADEEMRICVRRDKIKEDKFDVWIEGKEGGYAVKGTAYTAQIHPR